MPEHTIIEEKRCRCITPYSRMEHHHIQYNLNPIMPCAEHYFEIKLACPVCRRIVYIEFWHELEPLLTAVEGEE